MENIIIILLFLILGISYGVIIQRWKVFPFRYIQKVYKKITERNKKHEYGPWSIGIYKGPNPFQLRETQEVTNPVLTARDVSDVDAQFIADPFILKKQEKYFMFFELLNRSSNKGEIGYALSVDGINWRYGKKVLDEPFHLSYPHVFEWENNYYLIPESYQDLSVRLYKAIEFPEKWEYQGNLLNGYRFVDPTLFRFDGKWWLFVSDSNDWDVLNLYYSDSLDGVWKSHPANPIVKFNKRYARPGGRVFVNNGRPYRLAQDCEQYYGHRVFVFEITKLTEKLYSEKLVSEKPILGDSKNRWNGKGMHHLDMIKLDDAWLAVVDGQHYRKK